MLRTSIARSSQEMEHLHGMWVVLAQSCGHTLFQRFDMNLLAARIFSGRQQPLVISAETDGGSAIIPACIDLHRKRISLLGEELFDYRSVLTEGDSSALEECFRILIDFARANDLGFGFHSVVESDERTFRGCDIPLALFTYAPYCMAPAGDQVQHSRLASRMRRLQAEGCVLKQHYSYDESLVRDIYALKSIDANSLFADPIRTTMACGMAETLGRECEIFTLETKTSVVAALVTFLDSGWRRFYTTYYDRAWGRFSPGAALLYEIARQTLEAGLHCDFMTGQQPYKMRLATGSAPLFKVDMTAEQVASISARSLQQTA